VALQPFTMTLPVCTLLP